MTTPVVEYNITDAAIAELKDRYQGLSAETPKGYDEVKKALADLRTRRTDVEKTRKALKADALEYGRKVDGEAKRITAMIVEIEDPLKASKQAIDDEKDRIKREAEEAEKRELERLRAAEAERQRKAEEAERERIRKEQEAQAAKLKSEREALAKERAEQEERARAEREKLEAERKAEQEKLEAERRKIIEAQQKLERERIEQEAKERAEREAREKLSREKAEREQREKEAEEKRRLAAERLPDKEKLFAYVDALRSVDEPTLESDWAVEMLTDLTDGLWSATDAFVESLELERVETA